MDRIISLDLPMSRCYYIEEILMSDEGACVVTGEQNGVFMKEKESCKYRSRECIYFKSKNFFRTLKSH